MIGRELGGFQKCQNCLKPPKILALALKPIPDPTKINYAVCARACVCVFVCASERRQRESVCLRAYVREESVCERESVCVCEREREREKERENELTRKPKFQR